MTTITVTNHLAGLDGSLRDIGAKLHPVIEAALPGAVGAMWHGHPVWGLGVKQRAVADVDPALFADWLRQAHELETR